MPFTAIVLGGSGLTGRQLLRQLLDNADCTHVRALARTPLDLQHPKLETILLDFHDDTAFREALQGQVLFCCIGTTIRKAGSQAAFRAVDYDIPARAATFAKMQGVQQFLLISSIGAGIGSSNFYLRTKGEAERAVQQAGLRGVHIFRPSFLLGHR
ncbi:MAG TPA: NAD(P)H-binding protein, partial [Chitinophaga sp.]